MTNWLSFQSKEFYETKYILHLISQRESIPLPFAFVKFTHISENGTRV